MSPLSMGNTLLTAFIFLVPNNFWAVRERLSSCQLILVKTPLAFDKSPESSSELQL